MSPVVGVLGAGQLGRMLALAGARLGIGVRCFDPSDDPCAAPVCAVTRGQYEDHAALERFAQGLTVVTYEFENVPVSAASVLASRVPTFPPPGALGVCQDRLEEKTLFRELGIPTPGFVRVDSQPDLDAGVAQLGLPAVLKTRRLGYDGKGQAVLRTSDDVPGAHARLGGGGLILEAFVPFARELSIIAVRSPGGACAFYPLTENHHAQGVLRVSRAPALGLGASLQSQAEGAITRVLTRLNYVGVLALELFEHEGRLIANELAPRVHNSGHWTMDACACDQFENHLRAVLDLPLGDTSPVAHAGMVNLVGAMPERERILAIPGARLHHYAKAPRPGRKLGHVNVLGDTPEARNAALRSVIAACAGTGISPDLCPADLR